MTQRRSSPFPAYTYVPGRRPHPSRDPKGHSYGRAELVPDPMDPTDWDSCDTYLRGVDLFDHGYYWEAHEAWEGLWIAAGRTGALGELLHGLIKLAAAGVKVRQGLGAQAIAFAERAAQHFVRARELCAQERLAGLVFVDLMGFAETIREHGDTLVSSPTADVEVVFDFSLMPERQADHEAG